MRFAASFGRRTVTGAFVFAATAICAACHRTSSPAPETLRGIVKTVGTARLSELVLQKITADSARVPLRASATDAAALARVTGAVVALYGDFAAADTLTVSSFRVVEVDGQPVVDGVVRSENGRLSVCPSRSPCLPFGNPPNALRTLIGARIWIGGPPATGPNTFGVIVPAG